MEQEENYTYVIETGQDREQNSIWLVTVYRDGIEHDEDYFYTPEDAEKFINEEWPCATEERK